MGKKTLRSPAQKKGKKSSQKSHMEGDKTLEKYREPFKLDTNQSNSIFKHQHLGSSCYGSGILNLTTRREDKGLIPGSAQWVTDPVVP